MLNTPRKNNPNRIMIVAGEASGDMHGAKLVTSVRSCMPATQFFGIGGAHMRAAGVNTFFDANKITAVGLTEVFHQLTAIIAAFKLAVTALKEQKPDLLILIDYPGFNLRLAKKAKKYGVKVLYYISPQIWAWKEGRIHTIKKYVDQMAVIFPFEVAFYRKHGMEVKFVGHPLVTEIKETIATDTGTAAPINQPIIGLLPGSRKSEIKTLLPIMLKAAELLQQQHQNILFVLPLAHTLTDTDIAPYLAQATVPIKIIHNNTRKTIQNCTAVIAASGTVTLETALLGVPMVVIYKVSAITYYLGKLLAKVNYLCICNIIANKEIVKELLQNKATPEIMSTEIDKLLTDHAYYALAKSELNQLRAALTSNNENTEIVELIKNM